jgi:hypothetical protein
MPTFPNTTLPAHDPRQGPSLARCARDRAGSRAYVEFLRSYNAIASNILNDRKVFPALLRRSVTRRNPLLTFARRFDP